MKNKGMWIGIIIVVAVGVLLFWPAPDPLADVQTVSVSGPAGGASLAGELLQGLEIALGDRKITIVNDPNVADATIRIDTEGSDLELKFDEDGFKGSASIKFLVTTADGKTTSMFLNLKLDQNGLQADIEGQKIWEFWK